MPRPSQECHNAGTLKYRDQLIAHFAGYLSRTSLMLIKNRPFSHQLSCAPSAARLRMHSQELARLTRFRQAILEIERLDMETIAVTAADVMRATEISQQFGLLTNDAVVVAVMERQGLKNLASNDGDFDRLPTITRFTPI